MGVTGLWKLIEPCGKPVPVETLEGKILAVDISIWLHQVVKGFQDNKGSALNNAHLLGLFHRLCKLLYYRVKPVFVFDGCVPQLKKDTIARRQQQRSKLNNEADRIQALLLQSLAKEKVVQQALGSNTDLILKTGNKRGNTATRQDDEKDTMYMLPELPSTSKTDEDSSDMNNSSFLNFDPDDTTCTEESSFDESNARFAYYNNLQSIDVKSQHFKSLPAEVRHEILVDIKETRKQSSWGRLHELPSKKDDFSLFQMKRLLKRRAVQESLEEAQNDMSGVTLSYTELQNFFTEEGILESDVIEKGSKQICSDENTRFLLVRDLKKKLTKESEKAAIKEESEKDLKMEENEESEAGMEKYEVLGPSEPKIPKLEIKDLLEFKEENKSKDEQDKNQEKQEKDEGKDLGKEYDYDLEKAIALSLEDDTVYNEKDYEYESAKVLKLNSQQRKELKNAAIGPARAYMIEYGGMNDEEVEAIASETMIEPEDDDRLKEFFNTTIPVKETEEAEKITLRVSDDEDDDATRSDLEVPVTAKDPNENLSQRGNSQEIVLQVSDDESTDSDLVEVPLEEPAEAKPKLEIVVNVDKALPPEEDFFADIFEDKKPNGFDALEPMDFILSDEDEDAEEKGGEAQEQDLGEEEAGADGDVGVGIREKAGTEDAAGAGVKEKDGNDDFDIPESEEFIDETPQFIEVKSIFEKYRSPIKKEEPLEKPVKSPPVLESLQDSQDKMLTILEELKKQREDIVKLSLNDINNMSVETIVLSDDDSKATGKGSGDVVRGTRTKIEIRCDVDEKKEVIEIFDSQEQKTQMIAEASKSPKQKTPNKSIKEFFPTNYVVKRTPDKPKDEEITPSKVPAPFFVNKSSRSCGKKSPSTSPTLPSAKKDSKASKNLFPEETPEEQIQQAQPVEEAEQQAKEDKEKPEKPEESMEIAKPSTEDMIKDMAETLKEQKTEEELQTMADELARERRELETERNRQDRMGMSISQRMSSECQELLRLFGIPYIVAPMEAEAQCAFLDAIQLTNGTITDDSDIWLFGGRTVYKNFFAQNKHVLEFKADSIEKSFNCDRNKLIQLACLVGSDYTPGIHGIGAVTALEILASFSSGAKMFEGKSLNDDSQLLVTNILSGLSKFRDWWLANKSSILPPGSSSRLALFKKLKNIELQEGFPSMAVVEAYLSPKVDESKEAFTWGYPDVESIKEFARRTFGWTSSKTNDILGPVLKKLNDKKTQATIRNYFASKGITSSNNRLHQMKVSKRVQNAIAKMTGEMPETPEMPVKAKRAKRPAKAKESKDEQNSSLEAGKEIDPNLPSTSKGKGRVAPTKHTKRKPSASKASASGAAPAEDVASTSKQAKGPQNGVMSSLQVVSEDANNLPINVAKKVPRIPNTKEVIPQREKDLQQLQRNKEKAAEFMRAQKLKKPT